MVMDLVGRRQIDESRGGIHGEADGGVPGCEVTLAQRGEG
jgi:hypothetical protein